MALRIGVDFGTATTCAAVVRDMISLQAETIDLDTGTDLVHSDVLLSRADEPLVRSRSQHSRHPVSVFSDARTEFKRYWRQRVHAQADGLRWFKWNESDSESTLLLTYFKPELADVPRYVERTVVSHTSSTFDPLAQAEYFTTYYTTRRVAEPNADTHDLVAATASIIRRVVSSVYQRYRQPVERLMIGMPSYSSATVSEEARNAQERRREAIDLSGIPSEFGTRDFRVDFVSEAEAAGFGIDTEDVATRGRHLLVIDMGAGTTDFALIRFARNSKGRLEPSDVLAQSSLRLAGRNINEAIAEHIKQEREARDAFRIMDERAMQLYLDIVIEQLKREMRDEVTNQRLRFDDFASHAPGSEEDYQKARKLLRTAVVSIGCSDAELIDTFAERMEPWKDAIGRFLRASVEMVGRDQAQFPLTIELVGGGMRFPLARRLLDAVLDEEGLVRLPVRFADDGDNAQRIVARGLARKAALAR